MPNRKAKRKAKRYAQQKAQIAPRTMPPKSPDTSKTIDSQATSDVNKPTANSKWRFTAKQLAAIVLVLGLVVAVLALFPPYWSVKPTQEQANQAKRANDWNAGRFAPKAEVVALIPDRASAVMKALDKPIHPDLKVSNEQGEPVGVITFDDVHDLCRVNPRVRLKNTGHEIIESVQIHVEELSVMPIGPHGPYFVRGPQDQLKGPVSYNPTLKATRTEDRPFAEVFKPGDESDVDFARPLIMAMQGAQVLLDRGDHAVGKGFGKGELLFPGWNGKYHGTFKVDLYVRAFGNKAPDRTLKGPIPLGFIWSGRGFNEQDCQKILDQPVAPLTVASVRE
jgi:hypothetical protein